MNVVRIVPPIEYAFAMRKRMTMDHDRAGRGPYRLRRRTRKHLWRLRSTPKRRLRQARAARPFAAAAEPVRVDVRPCERLDHLELGTAVLEHESNRLVRRRAVILAPLDGRSVEHVRATGRCRGAHPRFGRRAPGVRAAKRESLPSSPAP